ncbi:MAG: ABC transporter substrate-binding protein [Rudaea sp.]
MNHSRRLLLLAAFAVLALAIAGCSGGGAQPTSAPATSAPAPATSAAAPATSAPSAGGTDLTALAAAAKQEGQLTVIALPHDWCGYGDLISGFKTKYGLTVNELNPDGSSAQEIEAIKANKDNKGPQAPDVIDMGFSFGKSSKDEGLLAPYKVSTWNDIPDSIKDADGYWYGDYYGVLAFEVNSDVAKTLPQDWSDLLKPDYKSQVALSGDPRQSTQAILSVYAAALANGGSLDNVQPGLDYFAKLNKEGNLVPVISTNALVAKGETPVRLTWDYNALAHRDQVKGNPKIDVVIPKSGQIGGVYVQAISAFAPHPNAAKLWMEYLYSDEGQIGWLKGYCHPARYQAMQKANKVPSDVAAKLPPADNIVLPSLDQLNKAQDVITKNWNSVVGADIKAAP